MTTRRKRRLQIFARFCAGMVVVFSYSEAWAQKIVLWPGETLPAGWRFCDGALLNSSDYPKLYEAIGTRYGGEGKQFAVPDLRQAEDIFSSDQNERKSDAATPLIRYIISEERHETAVPPTPIGGVTQFAGTNSIEGFALANGQEMTNGLFWKKLSVTPSYAETVIKERREKLEKILGKRFAVNADDREKKSPRLPAVKYVLKNDPRPDSSTVEKKASPVTLIAVYEDPGKGEGIGEIALFAGDEAPKGWMRCDGTLLELSETAGNNAIYSVLGWRYGGGVKTGFALPDLREFDVMLRSKAGLKFGEPCLFHAICVRGIYPSPSD